MKAKARVLTGIPMVTEKISHPKPSDSVGSQQNSTISYQTYNCQQQMKNDDKAGQEYNDVLYPQYLLTDIEVNAACPSVGNKWTDVTLRDCPPIHTKKFQVASKLYRVLHDSTAQHWIAVSNLNAPKGYTTVFDSIAHHLKKEQLEAVHSGIVTSSSYIV